MTRCALLLLTLLALAVAGCGSVTNVRERDLFVRGDAATAAAREAPDRQTRGVRIATARIVFITHGQASDEFWKVVQRGEQDARKQSCAAVSYRSPDSFSIERMRRFIDEAVADRPDGLIVSLPDAKALGPSIKAAVKAGIPVVTINSGSDEFRKLGVLAHVGQDEYKAGVEAGRRMGRAGVKRALCVNQENGNTGLDQRCRGLADGLEKTGGTAKPLPVPLQNANLAQRRMAEALASGPTVDGIVTLGPGGAKPALDAVRASGLESRVTLATFDLSPDVLAAVRDGKMLFAVDQQPYLQGYLPVVMLANRARYGLFPAQGDVVATGANFVTRANADQAIELSRRSIR
jgi:simple sugar transport system substrate-binding protein